MCVRLLFGDLNPDSCPQHPTRIYICGVITVPRVCGSENHIVGYSLHVTIYTA